MIDKKKGKKEDNQKTSKTAAVLKPQNNEPKLVKTNICKIASNNKTIIELLESFRSVLGNQIEILNSINETYNIQKCFLEIFCNNSLERCFKIFNFDTFDLLDIKDNFIKKLLHNTCTLFVYSIRKAKAIFKPDQPQAERKGSLFYDTKTLLKEVTPIYVNEKWSTLYKMQFYVNRSRYVKIPYVVQSITELNKHNPYNLTNDELTIEIVETLKLEEAEKIVIPDRLPDFIYTRMYCIATKLRPSHMLKPGAKPIGTKVNDREVYLRRDLWKLYTKAQWRNRGLDIADGEEPMKVLEFTGWKAIEYFHESQTVPLKFELTADGKIPKNEYGNIEIMNGLPPGTRHLNMKGVKFILKKMDIDWVPAVTEFEFKNGRFFPVLSGVVVHDKDFDMVMNECVKRKEEIEKREALKEDKICDKLWKDVFKSLYTKKYFKDKQN